MSVRVGIGFDAHRLVPGRKLVLAGEPIDHPRGLDGHSDGDAVLHALADALFGSVAAGDIGTHFPSENEEYRGAPSRIFVSRAKALVEEKGFRVQQADIVVIAAEPRLAGYVERMRARLAELLGLSMEDVGLKATTTDGMGFTGRGEGIAVTAVVTVAK